VIHALALLACMLLAGTLVARVPTAALAAILVAVGWRLVAFHELKQLWRISRFEAGIFIATMLGIVLTDFIDGVLIGLVLALINFAHAHRRLDIDVAPPEAAHSGVVRVEGPIFFASHTHLEALGQNRSLPPHVVLDLEGVPSIDVTGLQTLRALVDELGERGITVSIARAQERVTEALDRAEITPRTAGGRVHESVPAALAGSPALVTV
jgi:SulP family sulfate permease